MRVAITVAGEPRFCEEFDHFLDKLTGFDQIDWYFFLWKESYPHPFYKSNLIAPNWRVIDQDWATQKITENLPANHRLAKLVLADQKDYESPPVSGNIGYQVNVYNVWKMYQSLKESDALRNDETYDLVIRTRPDVMLEQDVDLTEIYQQLQLSPKSIIFPNNHWHGNPAINDWTAISTPDNMSIYSSVIDNIKLYYDMNIQFHPETLLGFHVRHQGLDPVAGNFGVGLRLLGQNVPGVTYYSKFGRWA